MYRRFITVSTIKSVQAEWTFWTQQGQRVCTANIDSPENDSRKRTGSFGFVDLLDRGYLARFKSLLMFILTYLPMEEMTTSC